MTFVAAPWRLERELKLALSIVKKAVYTNLVLEPKCDSTKEAVYNLDKMTGAKSEEQAVE